MTIEIQNCIYRFINKKGEIIYVGKAKELSIRLQNHDHLSEECYKEVQKIEYVKFKYHDDLSIAERYYISKYKPKYNKEFSHLNISLSFVELDKRKWKPHHYRFKIKNKEPSNIIFLNDMEINRLINIFDLRYFNPLRNKMIIETIIRTGMRVSEIVNLKWEDINFDEYEIKLNIDKSRTIPMSFETKDILEYWKSVQEENLGECDLVFCTRNKIPIMSKDVTFMVKKYSKKAKINKNVSCSTLRHTYAVKLLKRTSDIRYVQKILGLSSLTSVSMYLDIINAEVKK